MELREIYLVVLRKKFYLIIIPFITGAIMFLARFSSEREYVSESQLSTGITMTQGAFGETVRLSPYAIALEFTNLIETIKSKRVVNRLNYQLLLHDLTSNAPFRYPDIKEDRLPIDEIELPGILDTLNQAIREFTLIDKSTNAGRQIDFLLAIYGYTERGTLESSYVYRKGESEFINIQFISENPWLSAHMVNTWSQTIIEYYNYTNASRQSGSLVILNQIKDQKENKLNASIAKLNEFRASNEIVNSQAESVFSERIDQYRKELSDEESNARRIQLTLENLRNKIAGLNTNSSSNNRNEITDLNKKISSLSDRLFDEPDNAQIRSQLNQARSDLQEAMYKYNSSSNSKLDELFDEEYTLEVELSVSLERISRLKDDYYNARRDVRAVTSKASTLEILEGEVTSAREEYLKAEAEYSNAASQSTIGTSTLQMSYAGEIPEQPEPRKTVMFTALGFSFGLFTTLFFIVALEFLDNRIKNPAKFKRVLGNDPIGIVRQYENNKSDFAGIIQGKFDGLNAKEADSFLRNLRKIRFEFESHKKSIFLFTSLGKGTGKSFLLSSIAYSLSLADKRVLIIDTNFRDNSISVSYNRYLAQNGIKNVGSDKWIREFSGKRRLTSGERKEDEDDMNEQVDSDFITRTINRNIDLVISRNIQDSPLEIFSKVKFSKVLDFFLKRYDFVFMEGAALNYYSDTKELSRYSSIIVPVYSINDKTEATDKASIKFIENSNNDVKMILNNVRLEDIGES